MIRHLAKLVCLIVAGVAGWFILTGFAELFDGWIPPVAAVFCFTLVYSLLYFPLARPIADIISDRLSVMTHRGRHIRTGSGLDEIPTAPKPVYCSICGGPNGPICPKCNSKMTTGRQSRISLKP